MNIFPVTLNVERLDEFCRDVTVRAPRRSAAIVNYLIDIASHQGDIPANIHERVLGLRDSSKGDSLIKALVDLDYCLVTDASEEERRVKHGPRRRVWLSEQGARRLGWHDEG
jgi:hypothetical protein